ncbi:MAG: hypothetical protein M5U09_18800 [Gammaproteobacteria bacterium]|nr:hypothetical protein [Gammaproteobacteria bacterium]
MRCARAASSGWISRPNQPAEAPIEREHQNGDPDAGAQLEHRLARRVERGHRQQHRVDGEAVAAARLPAADGPTEQLAVFGVLGRAGRRRRLGEGAQADRPGSRAALGSGEDGLDDGAGDGAFAQHLPGAVGRDPDEGRAGPGGRLGAVREDEVDGAAERRVHVRDARGRWLAAAVGARGDERPPPARARGPPPRGAG